MGFSRENGPFEGAILIVASSIKEAKRIGAVDAVMSLFTDEYTDVALKWIRESEGIKAVAPLGDQDKIKAGSPHIVTDPECCPECGLWGQGVDMSGDCLHCDQPAPNVAKLFSYQGEGL